MKLLPMVAILAAASAAAVGYGAGVVIADSGAVAAAPARVVPAPAPLQTPAATILQTASDAASAAGTPEPHLVKMANVTVPVRKHQSVTYVVADFAVALADARSADHFKVPHNAAQLQAAIETAMLRAAGTGALGGVAIDADALSGRIVADLREDFSGVEDLLFLTLYKHDVGYN